MKINLLGGGTWGIALCSLLSKNDHNVNVWLRNPKSAIHLSKTRKHPKLNNYSIPESINFTSDLSKINFDHLTIIAIPSHAIYDTLKELNFNNSNFLIASKGFDLNSSYLPSQLLNKKLNVKLKNIAVMSGPNHAEEIVLSKATASVIASSNKDFRKGLQHLLSTSSFRIYTSDDLIGVQIGGAVKNVIAIASGLCVGLNLGDNTQAALVSRGMNEIVKLSNIYNININTLYGLSGLGDLVATCYSEHSRNREFGKLISEGHSLDDSNKVIGMVSEGINSCKILNSIIDTNKLDMPICNEVYNIIFKNHDPRISLDKLMNRNLKDEV